MSKLLLNLRHVPDDEADEVRAMLDARRIAFFETQPSRWGVSAGAIWITDDAAAIDAGRCMAEYQARRQAHARADREQARRDGTAATVWTVIRDEPLRVLLTLLSVAVVLGIIALPVILMSR